MPFNTLTKILFAFALSSSCLLHAAPSFDEDTQIISRSPLGVWMLKQDLNQPKLNCAIRFISTKDTENSFSIFGATKKLHMQRSYFKVKAFLPRIQQKRCESNSDSKI
jgi:hypothetical protein